MAVIKFTLDHADNSQLGKMVDLPILCPEYLVLSGSVSNGGTHCQKISKVVAPHDTKHLFGNLPHPE